MSELVAYLDGVRIGVVAQSAGGSLSFTYDDDDRADPEATPLSLSLPLVAQARMEATAGVGTARERLGSQPSPGQSKTPAM